MTEETEETNGRKKHKKKPVAWSNKKEAKEKKEARKVKKEVKKRAILGLKAGSTN
jgi:hypothetical protein